MNISKLSLISLTTCLLVSPFILHSISNSSNKKKTPTTPTPRTPTPLGAKLTNDPSAAARNNSATTADITSEELQLALTQALKEVPELQPGDLADPAKRARYVAALDKVNKLERAHTEAEAKRLNIPLSGTFPNGRYYTIERFINGRPVYKATTNANSAIAHATNLVNTVSSSYNLQGQGMTAGVWDANANRTSHNDFDTRATQQDSASSTHYHHTHVAGTVGGSGAGDASARGMAPQATLWNYDWSNDQAEMTSAAAAIASPPASSPLSVSNHSYGPGAGWEYTDQSGTNAWHWQGDSATDTEDPLFGLYHYWDREIDRVCAAAPYYLPFYAAGNDGNDGPSAGSSIYLPDGSNGWTAANYNAATHPQTESSLEFDTIAGTAVCKNVVTVGAISNGHLGGTRNTGNANITSFSSWGPTDDGRIKPDLVARGQSVYSTYDRSDTDYDTISGTSMAAPGATGSAVLIQQRHKEKFSDQLMRASSLKGLMIHTADDLGRPGPDYTNGWGLINTKAAIEVIDAQEATPSNIHLTESTLNSSTTSETYEFQWDGSSSDMKFTICWTDPGTSGWTSFGTLDEATRRLVNDLDIRLTTPSGATISPWVLDPANPATNATTGDNDRDNVEQIVASSPEAGTYTLTVSHKGSLNGNSQVYSLIMTGQKSIGFDASPETTVTSSSFFGSAIAPTSHSFTLSNSDSSSIAWTASDDAAWLELSSTSGTLSGNSNTILIASFNSTAEALTAGSYTAEITINAGGDTFVRNVVLEIDAAHAHWKLDEESGSTATDNSGNNFTGTHSASGLSIVDGVDGKKAVSVNGTSGHVTLPALNTTSDSITISAWIKRNGTQSNWSGVVFHRASGTASGLNVKSDNSLAYHWRDANNTWGFNSGITIPDNQWCFVALTVSPTKATLYLHDGTNLSSAVNSVAHSSETFSSTSHIGHDSNFSNRRFDGTVDDVRIYQKELTQAELLKVLADGLSKGGQYAFENGITGISNLNNTGNTDGDSFTNLEEYALSLNANAFDTPLTAVVEGNTFKLNYTDNAQPGVTITPQWSIDLSNWFSNDFTTSATGAEIPQSGRPKLFLRLNVEEN